MLFHFFSRASYGNWLLVWPDVVGQGLNERVFEEDEARFVKWFLKPGMVVFDIGAHIGFYTVLAAKEVREKGYVVAFEPSPRERCRLKWNLLLNNCHNVQVEPFALSFYYGQSDFFIVQGRDTGCNSMRFPAVEEVVKKISVPTTTLDNYLSKHSIDSISFIKLDAEGAELDIFKGACRLLNARPRPVVMCELIDMRTIPWNYKAKDIYVFLTRLGYVWFSIMREGYLCMAQMKDRYHENLIAVPEEKLFYVKGRIKE